ncbi:MAG: 50S ribosomal protein L31e [Candidatus Micrarchaeota archaeon]
MAELERIYTIPLGKAYDYSRVRRARRAVKIVRSFLSRHMKAEDVKISEKANELLFRRGMQKPPRKVKMRAVKEAGVVRAYLIDEKPEEKKEAKKEEKKGKEPEEAPKEAHGKEAPEKGKEASKKGPEKEEKK